MESYIASISGHVSIIRNKNENNKKEYSPLLFFILLAEDLCLPYCGIK